MGKVKKSKLLVRTLDLLKQRPITLTYEQIERETGIKVTWLTKFATTGGDADSSVGRIETLYEYLMKKELVIA